MISYHVLTIVYERKYDIMIIIILSYLTLGTSNHKPKPRMSYACACAPQNKKAKKEELQPSLDLFATLRLF